ncbi:MAG TPA: N-acetylneuraminate synthase [Planctomycetes bacterium]|nr:N-acetylneuraminate synthase [Fuerstiella sp.]HIK95264.1 N-acetylneuraminate synthase [Planctomycetota bacterium]
MPSQYSNIQIGDRTVGDGHPCFVIAEAGVNHNGSVDRALQLIDCAANAGADAVKFQTFNSSQLVTKDAKQAAYQKKNLGTEQSQLDMLRQLELSDADHQKLMDHCQERGILFMSTPFDDLSADLLTELGVKVFKLPSGEMTNTPFLKYVAAKGRPLIVSTGMCSLGEVEAAVEAIEKAGNNNFVLLHCVSNYPADPATVNLRAMATMKAAFGRPVGYSDHTMGIEVGVASAALGACVLEKHFTLDRSLPGPDHKASLEPDELHNLMKSIRTVESAMGTGIKKSTVAEKETARAARKSLVTAIEIPAGTEITPNLIAIKRPGTGLPPAMQPHILNRRATTTLPAGHLLRLEDVA